MFNRPTPRCTPRTVRTICALSAALALLAAAGCDTDAARQAFREGSGSSFEDAANALADGLITGAFSVFNLGN